MALSAASKGAPLACFLKKLLADSSASRAYMLWPAAVTGSRRLYNTGAPLSRYDIDESGGESGHDFDAVDDRRRAREYAVPSFFQDVLDPFNPPRSLSRLFSLMEDATAPGRAAAPRRGSVAREDVDALYLRVEMPGLGKEHVKVWAEQNTLVIKGEGDKESGEEEGGLRYSSRVELPAEVYKMDKIKAEMKNGVLKVVVPKVKEEERKDVFQVMVE